MNESKSIIMNSIKLDLSITDFKEPLRHFVKKPRAGMVVKVHKEDRTVQFAIVKKAEPDTGTNCNRERLVVYPTDKLYRLNQCDYILNENRVRFVKEKR